MTLDRSLNERRGLALDLGNLGRSHIVQGDQQKAVSYLEQALQLDRKLGEKTWEALDLQNIAEAFAKAGVQAEAVARLRAALALFSETGDARAEEVRKRMTELGVTDVTQ
jgi:tetratricopeptide (TPR) repeat protein